jgi:hypothetical protein
VTLRIQSLVVALRTKLPELSIATQFATSNDLRITLLAPLHTDRNGPLLARHTESTISSNFYTDHRLLMVEPCVTIPNALHVKADATTIKGNLT